MGRIRINTEEIHGKTPGVGAAYRERLTSFRVWTADVPAGKCGLDPRNPARLGPPPVILGGPFGDGAKRRLSAAF